MADLSREAALAALERCRRSDAWSGVTVAAAITKYGLDSRSAALAESICLGTLQNISLLDFYIDSFSSSRVEPKVRDILRTAVYQLVFMDRIPPFSAVNEAVQLCKKLGFSRASGFVNAVLRKIASSLESLPEIEGRGTAGYLSVKYSHPEWLCGRIISEKGFEFAEAFLRANNSAARTAIQVNTVKVSAEELYSALKADGIACDMHPWLPDCIYVGGDITKLQGFDEGLFYVQDPAARLAVTAAGLKSGMSVLDCCAAPGGKSFAAAVDMGGVGRILACDIHEKKTALISKGAARLGFGIIESEAHDAKLPRGECFDAVICDVPCSGMGVIRKKPEIRYKSEEELLRLPQLQLEILSSAAESTARGGVLIYSTCTVFAEENEGVVRRFLEVRPDFSLERFSLPHIGNVSGGMRTFWPNVDDTDGFFVCKLRRNR